MVNYKDFIPKATTITKGTISWLFNFHYNKDDLINSRVLLIGDSICNQYNGMVREKLDDYANLSYMATSKCAADPDYLRELDFVMADRKYDFISFNNGLHSLDSNIEEWTAAYRSVIAFIQAKCPEAKLSLTLCTASSDPERNDKVITLNRITEGIAGEMQLPIIDLYTPMAGLNLKEHMADCFHYREYAKALQAEIIAQHIKSRISAGSGVKQVGTDMGPDGKIK